MKSAAAVRPTKYPGTLDQAVLVAQSRTQAASVPPRGAEDKVVLTALSGGQHKQVASRESEAQKGQSKNPKDKKAKETLKPCSVCSQEGHSAKACPAVRRAERCGAEVW